MDTVPDYFVEEFEKTMKIIENCTHTIERCFSSRVAEKGRYHDLTGTDIMPERPEVDLSGLSFPVRELPQNNVDRFVGRADAITAIHRALRPNGKDKPQHCCIWGLGGMGKSQTALRYANMSFTDNEWDVLLWMRAASEQSLNDSFSRSTIRLGLRKPGDQASPQEICDSLHHWLRASSKTNLFYAVQ